MLLGKFDCGHEMSFFVIGVNDAWLVSYSEEWQQKFPNRELCWHCFMQQHHPELCKDQSHPKHASSLQGRGEDEPTEGQAWGYK